MENFGNAVSSDGTPCVNLYLNRGHQQLDSNLVTNHIKAMIKTQFTLSVVAIQATIIEKFGYEILYKKALIGKKKFK